jgi:hypothetical protein
MAGRGRPALFPGKVKDSEHMKNGYLTPRGRAAFERRQAALSKRAGFGVSDGDTIESLALGDTATRKAIASHRTRRGTP